MLSLFLVLSFLPTGRAASDDAPPAGSIQGMVVDARTHQPLPNAWCSLISNETGRDPILHRTDETGRCTFAGVAPGKYTLQAEKTGYSRTRFGDPGWNLGGLLTLLPRRRLTDLVLRLQPHGKISGRISDEDDRPLSRIHVVALQSQRRTLLVPTKHEVTNEEGEYQIVGLPSGRYYVRAVPPKNLSVDKPTEASEEREDGTRSIIPGYYPSVVDANQAVAVDVEPGGDQAGIDIRLRRARTFAVRGRVVNRLLRQGGEANPDPTARRGVYLLPREGSDIGVLPVTNGAPVHGAEGDFELRGVTPGSYFVLAWYQGRSNQQSAKIPLEVDDSDIEDLEIVIQPGADLEIRAATVDDSESRFQWLSVVLEPMPDTLLGRRDSAISLDGSARFKSINPGTYRLNVSGAMQDFFVQSATFHGVDALEYGVDVRGGESSSGVIDIVLNPHGASIQGVVEDSDEEPVAAGLVVLVPEFRKRHRRDRYRFAPTDQHGAFSLRGVTPGKYEIFAWDQVEYRAWEDPDFIRRFQGRAERIETQEGEALTMRLRLIESGPGE